jgi:hypothetical protein
MRSGRLSLWFALSLVIFLLPATAPAMILWHYTLDSLVYLSTDIVIANVSKDAQGNITAKVTETLYGALQAGDKIDALTPFLTFFYPLVDGQKVVLFLDSRPRQYDFFHQDAAKSPFAVLPSGVYLIDQYQHVHEYFQQNNPGPYVAQGYMLFPERTEPAVKDDLALPSLDEVKARIAATIKSIQPIRVYLEKPVTRGDVPGLMKLLASRPRDIETCQVQMTDAINARVVEKLQSLNDPELRLQLLSLGGGLGDSLAFTANSGGNSANDSSSPVVKYLIATLSDRKKDDSLRIASLQHLLYLSAFHSGPHSGHSRFLPIDNPELASSASEVIATAKAIFNDPAENAELRSLSLSFLDLDNPQNVKDIQQVYAHTRSSELQFAIEQAFVDVSDTLYNSLNPSSGPVASIVQLAPQNGCVQPPDNQITFIIRFYSTRAFNERGAVVITGRIVLKNIKSGQSFELKNVRSMGYHYGSLDGVLLFRLDQLSDFSAGVYTLGMEYAHQFNHLPSVGDVDEVPSVGHTITIAITDSPDGKRLSIPLARKEYK